MKRVSLQLQRLLPNERQLVAIIGLFYLGLGYLSGSCVRMVLGAGMLAAASLFWPAALWIARQIPQWLFRAMAGLVTLVYLLLLAQPAQALFLGRLCGLMLQVVNIPGVGATSQVEALLKATVNVVRGLFILYLAIALIGVFNSLRNDEDWQQAARTPILAVIIVGIVEAISFLVVPSGVQTC
ncbi:MAG: hypothetical protein NZ482_01860 [Gloeomargarita sp. SKYG98]|nr:hypothetical protein [Gloeomargarita sp. SKYG98]